MAPEIAAEMIEKLQKLPDEKQAHFKLTIVSLMQCYLESNVSGALLLNYEDDSRCAVISIGMMEEDLIDCMERLVELLLDPDQPQQITLQ